MDKKEIEKLDSAIEENLRELFGSCEENSGVYRSVIEHVGVLDTNAILEIAPENGVRDEVPYPSLQFHLTLAQDVDEDVEANLLISLNSLNHVIAAGAFPSFGTFVYYMPLRQVYLSYRMPVNPDDIDAAITDMRYILAVLYEQLDLFMDFILYTVSSPEGISIDDYMDYLDEVSDLDDIITRSNLLLQMIENGEGESNSAKETD